MGKWGLSEQVGAWWFPWECHRELWWQYPGMPFMEDQGDSASPLRNGGGKTGRNEKIK